MATIHVGKYTVINAENQSKMDETLRLTTPRNMKYL
jgi:hypothetical protein